jgi:hypothetical protein
MAYQSPIESLLASLPAMAMQYMQGQQQTAARDKELEYSKQQNIFNQAIQNERLKWEKDERNPANIAAKTQAALHQQQLDELNDLSGIRKQQEEAELQASQIANITAQETQDVAEATRLANTAIGEYQPSAEVDIYDDGVLDTSGFNFAPLTFDKWIQGLKDSVGDNNEFLEDVDPTYLRTQYGLYTQGHVPNVLSSLMDEYTNEWSGKAKNREAEKEFLSTLVGSGNMNIAKSYYPQYFDDTYISESPLEDLIKEMNIARQPTFWETMTAPIGTGIYEPTSGQYRHK